MAIEKKFLKAKPECTVTFSLSQEYVGDSKNVFVVGSFNDWNYEADPMKFNKTKRVFSLAKKLEVGKEYQFRYLLDGGIWINDEAADKYEPTTFGDADNCVVTTYND